jgi:hypothetical protein
MGLLVCTPCTGPAPAIAGTMEIAMHYAPRTTRFAALPWVFSIAVALVASLPSLSLS